MIFLNPLNVACFTSKAISLIVRKNRGQKTDWGGEGNTIVIVVVVVVVISNVSSEFWPFSSGNVFPKRNCMASCWGFRLFNSICCTAGRDVHKCTIHRVPLLHECMRAASWDSDRLALAAIGNHFVWIPPFPLSTLVEGDRVDVCVCVFLWFLHLNEWSNRHSKNTKPSNVTTQLPRERERDRVSSTVWTTFQVTIWPRFNLDGTFPGTFPSIPDLWTNECLCLLPSHLIEWVKRIMLDYQYVQ